MPVRIFTVPCALPPLALASTRIESQFEVICRSAKGFDISFTAGRPHAPDQIRRDGKRCGNSSRAFRIVSMAPCPSLCIHAAASSVHAFKGFPSASVLATISNAEGTFGAV